MAANQNPFAPQEFSGPFIQSLTQQPEATQSPQQFSGFQGKLGAATGLVAKFLSGAAEGRMRQAQKIENDKAQKFAAIARIGQQISNDSTLTDQAKSEKQGAIMKIMAQQVLDQTGGDKKGGKGQDGEGHPALGFIKNIATRLAGGPLPKKWDGPSADDILKIAAHGPNDTIQGQAQQFETAIGEKAKGLPKDYTTDDLQKSGVMQIIGQAQQSGAITPGMQTLLQKAQENHARAGRLSEKESGLKLEQQYGSAGEAFEKSVAPAGTKDASGQDISGKTANRVTNKKTGQFIRWDMAAPTAADRPARPHYATLAGPKGNPVIYQVFDDGTKKEVGAAPVGTEWKVVDDELKAVPKYANVGGEKAPPPPGQGGTSAAPKPPGTSSAAPKPPGAPEAKASDQVKSYASKFAAGDLKITDIPAKQRGKVMAYMDAAGIKSPEVLSPDSQKVLESTKPVLQQIQRARLALEKYKDNDSPMYLPTSPMFSDYLKYKAGSSSATAGLIADLSMSSILGASRILKGGGGVRAKSIFEEAQKHTPDVGKDSLKLIYEKLTKMENSINDGNAALHEYGRRSGVPSAPAPPSAQSDGKTAAPAVTAPPAPPSQRKSLDQIFQ